MISRIRASTSRSISANSSSDNLAELEPHLRFEQLLAQRRIVLRLGLGGRHDLVEDEAEAADEERIEDEHGVAI